MPAESTTLDSIAAAIGVGGCGRSGCPWAVAGASPFLDNVYSLGGGAVPGVKDFPDDIAMGGLPALVVMDGGLPEIVAGSYEVTTWAVEVSVWVENSARGERLRQLLNFREPIRAAFRAHAKGGLADVEISSVLLTAVGGLEYRQWARRPDAPTYLVLPFTAQAIYRRAVTYQPA